jgi:uncharacterized protein (DUF58 family)
MAGTQGRLQIGLTDAGKVVFRGLVFVVLAALLVPVFGVLSILLAVFWVAVLVGFILRPKVEVSGDLPDRVIAGQATRVTYTLRNVGRLPAYSLSLRYRVLPAAVELVEDAPVLSGLRPGKTVEADVVIRPKRRGCHRIGRPVCESSFPFNLVRFGTLREEQENLLVLPPFFQVRVPLHYVSRHVTSGTVLPVGRAGTSPEYIGSRPFIPGDSPRRIDVRAWARLATPATKEYDNDLADYTAFVLDTRMPPGRSRSDSEEIPELEAAVSLCASLAYTIHRDCLIDLLLAGTELHEFAAWPKAARLDRIHEVLAGVEPSKEYSLEQIGPLLEERLQEISEVIFIVLRWDEPYRRLAEWARRAGCHTTIVLIGEASTAQGAESVARKSPSAAVSSERQTRAPSREQGSGETPWDGDLRVVSAQDILAGRVEQL